MRGGRGLPLSRENGKLPMREMRYVTRSRVRTILHDVVNTHLDAYPEGTPSSSDGREL